ICQLAPQDAFFEMLSNTTQAPDCRLPDTGISFERERLLSSPCIVSQDYGTRVSTLLRIHHDGSTEFMEKTLR
ncbi:NRDE family protein, partial [Undibacterium luofuense]